MVAVVHRFLRDQHPGDPGLPRHLVLQGSGVGDLVFHDMYNGCVSAGRSVELWAQREWGAASPDDVLVVRLTFGGDLDFTANGDPAAARATFDRIRSPRAPRYGQRRRTNAEGADTATAEMEGARAEEARAEAAQAATSTGESVGGGGAGLVNRMRQVAGALASRNQDVRLLVVVDDLGWQLEGLRAAGQDGLAVQAEQVLVREWLGASAPVGTLVVYLDPDKRLVPLVPPARRTGIKWWEVGAPSAAEIGESLRRVDARVPLGMDHPDSIAEVLVGRGDLRSALGSAALSLSRHGAVTYEGVLDLPPVDEARADEVLRELDTLVGLAPLKTRLGELRAGAARRRATAARVGSVPQETWHMVFTGNPGTGKTTVARIVGRYFHALGLLPSDRVTEISVPQLLREGVGESGQAMQEALDASLGGVLLLDEAQGLTAGDDPRARELVQALVPRSLNERASRVIVLAGYADGLSTARLGAADPGLPSRFPESLRFEFPDYTGDQLWTVVTGELGRRGLSLPSEGGDALRRLLERRRAQGGFGNARGAIQLVSDLQRAHDARGGTGELTLADLPPRFPQHPEALAQAEARLGQLIGLAAVRREIENLRHTLQYAEIEQESEGAVPRRLVFTGPPGTGKTTVAGVVGDLMYGLGLLSRPAVVATGAASLRAPYQGQTTRLVRELFERARGGVLVIDEVHGIVPQQGDSYGREALDTMLDELTRPENQETVVILADYEQNVAAFFAYNEGLARRFGTVWRFESLTGEECALVARRLLAAHRPPLTGDDAFFTALAEEAAAEARTSTFGNAGWVGNRVSAAIAALQRRVVTAPEHLQQDPAWRRRLVAEDLQTTPAPGADRPDTHPEDQRADTATDAETANRWRDESFIPAHRELPALAGPVDIDDPDVEAALAASVLQVVATTERGRSMATAFVVTHDGLAVTNEHVVRGARSVEVVLGDGSARATAYPVLTWSEEDLALVRIDLPPEVPSYLPLPLGASHGLPRRRPLVVTGYARVAVGARPRVVNAHVSSNEARVLHTFETDGAIEQGDSGGPFYDPAQGGVAGVVLGGLGTTVKVAVRVELVRTMLEDLGYVTGAAAEDDDATREPHDTEREGS